MCQPHGVLKKLIFYMRKRDKSKHTLCVCVCTCTLYAYNGKKAE